MASAALLGGNAAALAGPADLSAPVPVAAGGCRAAAPAPAALSTSVLLSCPRRAIAVATTTAGAEWTTRATPYAGEVLDGASGTAGQVLVYVASSDGRLKIGQRTRSGWARPVDVGSSACVDEAEVATAGGRWWTVWRQRDTRPGTRFCVGESYTMQTRTLGAVVRGQRVPQIDGDELSLALMPADRTASLVFTRRPAHGLAQQLVLATASPSGPAEQWRADALVTAPRATESLASAAPGCAPEQPCGTGDDPQPRFGQPAIDTTGGVLRVLYLRDGQPVLLERVPGGSPTTPPGYRESALPAEHLVEGNPQLHVAAGRVLAAWDEHNSDVSINDGSHAVLATRAKAGGAWHATVASHNPPDPGADYLHALTSVRGKPLVVLSRERIYSRHGR